MNRFFTWLFRNSEYKRIQNTFLFIQSSSYATAYQIWSDSLEDNPTSWSHKQRVAENFDAIKHLDKIVMQYKALKKDCSFGLFYVLKKYGKKYITKYTDYLWIEDKVKEIQSMELHIEALYKDLMRDRSSKKRTLIQPLFDKLEKESRANFRLQWFAENFEYILHCSSAINLYLDIERSNKDGLNYFLKEYRIGQVSSYTDCLWIEKESKNIRLVDQGIKLYLDLKKSHSDGLNYFLRKYEKASISKYADYLWIIENQDQIRYIDKDIKSYLNLKSLYADGVECLLKKYGKSSISSHEDYLWVLTCQKEVEEVDYVIKETRKYSKAWMFLNRGKTFSSTSKLLKEYDKLQKAGIDISKVDKMLELTNKYPLSWKLFSKGVLNIYTSKEYINKACSIPISAWKNKEKLLSMSENDLHLINILLGTRKYSPNSFAKHTLETEKSLLKEFNRKPKDYSISECDYSLGDTDELKRLILDYEGYGDNISFASSVTIPRIYSNRLDIDETGHRFADLVKMLAENRDAIKSYNSIHNGEAVTYVEDLVRIGSEESDLHKYVLQYNKTKEARSQTKTLVEKFNSGFSALFGAINIDDLSFEELERILQQEAEVKKEDNRIKTEERQRKEEERAKESRRKEILAFEKAVSTWPFPTYARVRCFSLYNYYPTTCNWEASSDEWDIRKLIWNFKANPNRPTPMSEIKMLHEESMQRVLPDLIKCLTQYFGSNLKKLTLVCIPSSKKEVTERRYKQFSEILTSNTGMANGYDYIQVVKDGGAKHLGETTSATYQINSTFFNGRYVLLFDDVITSGKSMATFANTLQKVGAYVVGGISLGRTKHQRELHNPIDLI